MFENQGFMTVYVCVRDFISSFNTPEKDKMQVTIWNVKGLRFPWQQSKGFDTACHEVTKLEKDWMDLNLSRAPWGQGRH